MEGYFRLTMKYYSLTQSSEFKTLVGRFDDLALYDAAKQYAFGKDFNAVFSRQYELEFSSDDKKKKDGSDIFTFFRPVLIVTSKAKALFQSVIPDSVHNLNVLSPNPDHSGIVLEKLLSGAFNKEMSEFDEYPSGLVVYKMVLNAAAIQGVDVFRVAENPLSIYVSEKFVEMSKVRGLKGFEFKGVDAI